MLDAFIADLHIHSRFSRATSTRLNLAHLSAWAGVKGIGVLGTGDFTHPVWRDEMKENLELDEYSGLYRLKKRYDPEDELPGQLGAALRDGGTGPLFLLQAEISSIYKRHGRVRKVHNLVFMPDFDAAERFCRQLSAVGNLNADGRPILGLDSALLLEMVLKCHPDAALVPAHIWTPWFSIFGSKSGFDSLEECFGDLAGEIFAMETGLSSDPSMIRLWSHLDRISLISNSDAHSGENLAREGNLFGGPPSYNGIFNALRGRPSPCVHMGSVEFFPEEGKYHLDGHRACQVVMEPEESRAHGNICPVCGKPLTIGVLNRVMELADRHSLPEGGVWPGFSSLIPLPEIIGEILGVGSKSKAVAARYAEAVGKFGAELDILRSADEDDLRRHWDALGEAVARMRRGEVILQGGYDGEYGVVRVFSARERQELKTAGRSMASLAGLGMEKNEASVRRGRGKSPALLSPAQEKGGVKKAKRDAAEQDSEDEDPRPASVGILSGAAGQPQVILTPEQEEALAGGGPTLIVAGPGSGKTRTLVEGVRRLMEHGENPDRILALTFTRRAAEEMASRLEKTLGNGRRLPHCLTLHALAWRSLQNDQRAAPQSPNRPEGDALQTDRVLETGEKACPPPPLLPPEQSLRALFAGLPEAQGMTLSEVKTAFEADSLAREGLVPPPAELKSLCAAYARLKEERNLADHTDILEKCLQRGLTQSFDFVFVDEIQDLTPLQLALARKIAPDSGQGFFGIGDPNQSIYSFRGVLPDVGARLREFWPDLSVKSLPVSHRSASGVLNAADSLLPGQNLRAARALPSSLRLFRAPNEDMEARWVTAHLALLLGGSSLSRANEAPVRNFFGFTPDSGHLEPGSCSPGDLAVLVRLKAQIPSLSRAMDEAGIPFAAPEEEGFWHDARIAAILREAALRFTDGPSPSPALLQSMPLFRASPDGIEVADKSETELNPEGPAAENHARTVNPEEILWRDIPVEAWQDGPAGLAKILAGKGSFDEIFLKSTAFGSLCALWRAEGGWRGLLNEMSFRSDLDEVKARAERVQIMTLHACKGLEFRAVFVCGLENGLLPLDFALLLPENRADGSDTALQRLRAADCAEERRLLNVGITRAAEAVFLSLAAKRKIWGITGELPPSPFITPLEKHCRQSILKSNVKSVGKKLSLF